MKNLINKLFNDTIIFNNIIHFENQMSDDEGTEEKKVAYSKITKFGLEDVKRAFCNNDFDNFKKLVKEQNPPFKLLIADYVDAEEFQGKMDFMLQNRGKGFVKDLEDVRQYFFVTFVCYKKDGKVVFKSYWIVNTNDELKTVLGSDYDSFAFTSCIDNTDQPDDQPDEKVDQFLDAFKTGGVEEYVSLNRLH